MFIVDGHYTYFIEAREKKFHRKKSTCFKSIKEIKQITPLSLSKKKKKEYDKDYNKVTYTPKSTKTLIAQSF